MEKKFNWSKFINYTIFVVVMLIVAVLVYVTWPYFFTESGKEEFKTYVESIGFGGYVLLLGMQILQVVVAVIPGQITEILGGVMYGTYFGTLLCLLGVGLGTVIIYGIFYLFKNKFSSAFISDNIRNKFTFLNDSRRLGIIYFSLFLIPGIPKDIFIYLAPTTKIKMPAFLFWSLLGRLPSTLVMCYLGDTVFKTNWQEAPIWENQLFVTVVVVSIIVSILCIVFNKQIANFLYKIFDNRKDEGNI